MQAKLSIVASCVATLFSGLTLADTVTSPLTQDTTLIYSGDSNFALEGSSSYQELNGANHSLTISGNWQTAIAARNGISFTLSDLSSLNVNIGSSDNQTGGVNALYAESGSTLSIYANSVNITTVGASASGQDAISLHAMAGSIIVDTKDQGDIDIENTLNGNAIMSQGNNTSDSLVKLNAGDNHDIEVTAQKGTAITVGTIMGTQNSVKSELELSARNITIEAVETTAINVYDTEWQTTDVYHPGISSIKINASNHISIHGGQSGIWQQRKFSLSGSESNISITAPSVDISGGWGAIILYQTTEAVKSSVDIKADHANLSCTADVTWGTLYSAEGTSLSFSPLNNERTSLSVSASAGNAIVANGTVSTTNADIDITKGNVTGTGNLALTNSDMELSALSTMDIGTLTADNASITVNAVGEDTIKIGTLTKVDTASKGLELKASSTLNDQYAGRADELVKALRTSASDNVSEQLAYGADEGLISGAISQDADGKTVYSENTMTSSYEAFNNFGFVQWRNQNNHISQRLGDVRNSRGAIGAWARVYGSETSVTDTVATDIRSTTIQVGLDTALNDTWIVGGALSYTDSRAEFDLGQGDSDGYSAAVYASGFFDCGGFVDLIGRIGRLSTDMTVLGKTAGNAFSASYDNTTFGLSAEVGYRLPLSQTFYAEPQFELSYGYVFGDDFSTSQGVKVEQDDYQSLVARLGAQLGAKFAENRGTVYLHASVNHDFLGDADSSYRVGTGSTVKAESDLGGTWISYGVGFQFNTTANLNLYGSLERANGNDYQDDYRYSVGLRYVW